MAKKRDKIRRRRDLKKARQGTSRDSRSRPSQTPTKKSAESAQAMDLWLAVGIVVVILAAFVALYYFTVQRPRSRPPQTPAIKTEQPSSTPEDTVEATPSPSPEAATEPSDEKPEAATEPTNEKAEVPPVTQMSWSEPPEMTIDTAKDYEAVIKTTRGDIRVELFDDKTPVTVNNFVFLAREGYYDGILFHRVIAGFMAQTGDPTGTGSGGPGYTFEDEFDPTLRHDSAGILSMANRGEATNGGQFFITYAPQPHLDDHHSVFGKVIEGMDIASALTPRDPAGGANAPGDRIVAVEIIES